ncbi:MAG: glycosyltransferase family 9 protein [candidate division KSB1 bacterium]|nr:glycosyltransferase family 9 protein [candidate division KSB1 bacterium]MDZ7276412.1 glycosyltransferase family 9 protein [candidate division KSB1 bacterium]MDZ7288083.1 glycosyltransferase family 9 protein [candidate division KSB1 bacterium]MDZ7300183.1 glycosyltransferase family 9 protein [candidate division KSB1 bacterium]MDZ7305755.1 glycosyltransferase family 9 protein [candidate division KSB1 bacterium]
MHASLQSLPQTSDGPAPGPAHRIQRILVSRLRFLGDVLLTTPVVRRLREVFPAAEIVYLTEAAYAPLLAHNPHLDEVLAFAPQAPLTAQAHFYRSLRRRRFDLVIDLFGNPRTALLSWITGAPVRVGGDFRGRGKLYSHRVPPPNGDPDAITFHLRSLEILGIAPGDRRTEVFLVPEERLWAQSFLAMQAIDPARPLVGMHPGASWPNKRWPASHFAEVAQALLQAEVQVILTQGPQEGPIVTAVKQQAPGVKVLPVLSLRETAAVLARCSAFVSNDCGILHLAVAVGTPTVGLFGPSQKEIWFPYAATHGHLALDFTIACRPCHQNVCPLQHLDCQKQLLPPRVLAAVWQALKQRPPAERAA